jgi:hypothetical protein
LVKCESFECHWWSKSSAKSPFSLHHNYFWHFGRTPCNFKPDKIIYRESFNKKQCYSFKNIDVALICDDFYTSVLMRTFHQISIIDRKGGERVYGAVCRCHFIPNVKCARPLVFTVRNLGSNERALQPLPYSEMTNHTCTSAITII